jgi:hypothetical protein
MRKKGIQLLVVLVAHRALQRFSAHNGRSGSRGSTALKCSRTDHKFLIAHEPTLFWTFLVFQDLPSAFAEDGCYLV